jgi:hypothetical protein
MFQVSVPQQCGCFRRSGKEASASFENKDDALMHAQEMAQEMNSEFCKKHNFSVLEEGKDFIIVMAASN